MRSGRASHSFLRTGIVGGWRGLGRSFGTALREGDWRRLVRFPLQGPVDLGLFVAGHAVSAVQSALGFQAPARPLEASERRLVREVFGDRVDLVPIRIVEGPSGLLGLPGRAFVLGNAIFFPSRWLRRGCDRRATLVHELVHVWQFQTRGLRYLSEALAAQWLGEGYDYLRGLEHGRDWRRLNPEQQAQLVEEAWRSGRWERGDVRLADRRSEGIERETATRDLLGEVLQDARDEMT